ncbi:hypothetical protein [Bifidobacterium samirii]|uniref:Histidine kinase n=1 Tax=Bifidobacterium samirii TaxID=2306974 RepID=A0A430FR53_9BIFI|nr:hypothetical protein [Bifidobacterium samirii]RSX55296.1 hypothetical protein D2E24_1431 [Bifidobacterium samirii]
METIALIVVAMIIVPPATPSAVASTLVCAAFVAVMPRYARTIAPLTVVAALATSPLSAAGSWTAVDFALIAAFLTAGYALSRRVAVAMLGAYVLIDAAMFTWLGASSFGGGVVDGMIDAMLGATADPTASPAQPAAAALPHYTPIIFVATIMFDLMAFGFLTVFGMAFRRGDDADERAVRSEMLLGRVTREQELAHVIHDAVANDMSTIAMLAWRAKGEPDRGERDLMLDTIYERSHHALDRVHEVIDVLNGKRSLDDVGPSISNDAHPLAFDMQIEKYLEDQDRVMTMLGLPGVSRVDVRADAYDDACDGAHDGPQDGAYDASSAAGEADGSESDSSGHIGHGTYDGGPAVSEPVRRVTMALLEEIYANLVRHCPMPDDSAAAMPSLDMPATGAMPATAMGAPTGAAPCVTSHAAPPEPVYSLFVGIDADRIRISAMNPIEPTPSAGRPRNPRRSNRRHGSGLALHRAAVESLGGTMTAGARDGSWMIGVELPLH